MAFRSLVCTTPVTFKPCEGTKLALGELTRIEEAGEDREEDEVDVGVVEA
jgi:hypothetical protein